MTYFGFLALFLGIPILILLLLVWRDQQRGVHMPSYTSLLSPARVIIILVLIALIYTTPWDNYLVATSVWWYDPALVTGYTIGWVPIEEYTFFVLQPIATGLWLFFWLRRRPALRSEQMGDGRLRFFGPAAAALLWLPMAGILAMGWQPGTYLALELVWALPPLMLQMAFGLDILWRYGRFVLLGIIPPTLYLAFADALAIQSGTWTIDPAQSLNIFIGGILPIEEFIFFLLTNILIVFGMTLAVAEESRERLYNFKAQLSSFWSGQRNPTQAG